MATSLATVCARVEYGLTWKTGNESFPSPIPRSLSITEMKCMQEACRRGRLLVCVRSLVSAVEILPTTFAALSTTAILVNPSLLMSWRASVRGWSPLYPS